MKTLHANLLFLLQDDQILLAMKKRGFGQGRWNGVGGKVEAGETAEEAVRRECQEEIMVTPKTISKVAVHEFIYKGDDNKPQKVLVDTFICTKWEGQPAETEEMAPQWFPQTAIPYDTMWPDDIYWLPLVLEGKKIITRFEFNEDDSVLTQKITVVKEL